MRALWKKVLLAFFAVLIATAPLLMLSPKPADALVGCLIGQLFNMILGGVKTVAGGIQDLGGSFLGGSVPVRDAGANTKLSKIGGDTGKIAASTKTIEAKECTLDGAAKMVARTILQQMTRSIVNWINTGFQGSPSFVTNPEGFMTDIADRVIGQEIESIAPMLCKPFRFNLQLALGLQFSRTGQDEQVRCRLSDVVSNVQGFYDSFVGGQFSAGGWQSWINIAGVPQNNAYGAYLSAQGQIHAGIVDAQGREIQLLNWGSGFKSWRSCDEWKTIQDPLTSVSGPTRKICVKEGNIKTPGSIIVGQTENSLGSTLRELEVADEIDEIFGALVNQLLLRAMGGGGSSGGLYGVSHPDSAGTVYINTIPTSVKDAMARASATKPFPNLDCTRNYVAGGVNPGVTGTSEATPLITALQKKAAAGDSAAQADLATINGRTNDILLVEAKDARGFNTGLNEIARKSDGTIILKEPSSTTWRDYMTNIASWCANETNRLVESEGEATIRGQLGQEGAAPGVDTTTVPPPPPEPTEGNLASGKKALQSSTLQGKDGFDGNFDAGNAVDGSKINGFSEGGFSFGLALTQEQDDAWWGVDLETDASDDKHNWTVNEINKIRIYGASGRFFCNFTLYRQGFKVYITKNDPFAKENEKLNQDTSGNVTYNEVHFINGNNGNTFIEITLPQGPPVTTGRYLKIAKMSPAGAYSCTKEGTSYENARRLGIAEVEVYGKQTRIQPVSAPPPEQPFSITANPATGVITQSGPFGTRVNPRSGETISQNVIFTGRNKKADNARLEIGLERKNLGQQSQATKLDADFTSFQITVTKPGPNGQPTTTVTPNFIKTEGCPNPTVTPRCMNTDALKGIDSSNNPETASQPIIFANNLSFPAPDSSISLTLTGTLSGGALGNIPPGTEYKITVRAVKPEVAPAANVETASVITFTIAP